MEHKLSPYILRCYSQTHKSSNPFKFWDGKDSLHYLNLDNINNHDLFVLFSKYLKQKHSSSPTRNSEEKIIFQISDLQILNSERTIYGYIQKGNWGTSGKIINAVKPDEPPRDLKNTDAILLKHFFYLYIPKGKKEAICIFHHIGQSGVKTIFSKSFREEVFEKVSNGLVLQYNAIQYGYIYEKWKNAKLKELKIRKFRSLRNDIADQLSGIMPEYECNLIVTAANTQPKLLDFLDPDKNKPAQIIEIMENVHAESITGTFILGDRRKVLKIGAKQSISSDILLDSEELDENGDIQHDCLLKLTKEIVDDITNRIYSPL